MVLVATDVKPKLSTLKNIWFNNVCASRSHGFETGHLLSFDYLKSTDVSLKSNKSFIATQSSAFESHLMLSLEKLFKRQSRQIASTMIRQTCFK
jgi:hypothetical protein